MESLPAHLKLPLQISGAGTKPLTARPLHTSARTNVTSLLGKLKTPLLTLEIKQNFAFLCHFHRLNATVLSAKKFKFPLKSTVQFDFAPESHQTCVQVSSCYRLVPVKNQLSSKNRYLSYSTSNFKREYVFLVFH